MGKDLTMLEYHAAYFALADGWYMAEVLDFPGAISQGKDLEDARYMIRDALRLMVECTLEAGQTLPKPNPRAKAKKAVLVESLRVTARILPVKKNEKEKTPKASASA
jgi:predicted RNase H-like HicB family nuclease